MSEKPEDEGEAWIPSRGDLSKKRKAGEKRLADLATALVNLPKKQLGRIELEPSVLDAIIEARRISSHTALARQMRIVRRELRNADHAEIAEQIERHLNPRARATTGTPASPPSPAATWAARCIENPAALETFLEEHPDANRQRLRTLIRNTSKANDKARASKHNKLVAALAAALRAGPTQNDALD